MTNPFPPATLVDLAEEQWGLFTSLQAKKVGISSSSLVHIAERSPTLERCAYGVYRLRGAPAVDHLELRVAWLQLAPGISIWDRTPDTGVVSHRSAASIFGLGHLPADVHEFTLPRRRQTRRDDVHLYRSNLRSQEVKKIHGLLVARPARIAKDLLKDQEDPAAVGYVIADSLRNQHDDVSTIIKAISPYAFNLGFRKDDGFSLFRWLLEITDTPERPEWLALASN